MTSRKVKKTVMAKRNLFTVKLARALRTMFGYSNDKAPVTRPQQRERRAVPQIYTRDYRHILTLAQPIVRDDQGYYIAHDEQGGVWRAVSGDIRHGWEAVPYEERPPLVQIRDHIPAEDEEERPIRAAARRAARRVRAPRRAEDAADIFDGEGENQPEEGEAHEYVPVGEELEELASAFSPNRAYTVQEILARGFQPSRFISRADGSTYALLSDGTKVTLNTSGEPTVQPARSGETERALYLNEPHKPSHNVINAVAVQWAIFNSLERFLDREECAPIRANMTATQRAELLEKTHKWAKHLVRKVLSQKRDLIHTLSPIYNIQTKEVTSLLMTDAPVSRSGYQTSPTTERSPLTNGAYFADNPWLKDLGVYNQATSRPVYLSMKHSVQVSYDQLVFGFVDSDGDRIAYGEEPELVHFVHPNFKFHPDSEVIRDIITSFIGFVMDPTITRNWAEYDIAKFGAESAIKVREFMLSYWMEETRKLPGYEQFYIGDHKGNPYVLVPLKTGDYTRLEGKAMKHCVGGYGPTMHTRYYSIREARRVNGELIPVRSRITFDVTCSITYDTDAVRASLEKVHGTPAVVVPPLITTWDVGSIKGIRNMNNPEWAKLVRRAGILIGVPHLGDHYHANEK